MDIIPMHLGVAHFKTPQIAIDAMQEALVSQETYYGPNEGIAELRLAVAQRYFEDDGIPVPAEQVLITHGTKHALHLFLQSFLQPGDEVIAPAPFWFAFPEMVSQAGGKLISLPPNPEEDYALPLSAIKEHLSPTTRLLLLTNPGNPTGRAYSLKELEAVAQLMEQHASLHVLSDEIYDGLALHGTIKSFLHFEHLRHRVTVVNGFSKSFAMSGWRIGYIIAPFPVLQKVNELQQKIISGVSPFTQVGAAAALRHRHQIWEGFKNELLQKREKVAAVLQQLPQLSYVLPDAGYYFTIDIKGCLEEHSPASPFKLVEEWAAALKEQVGLEVLPGTAMGMPTAVRMSYALPDYVLASALDRLSAFVKH
ncbi:pyridoxal phosphate-dependent aminotransferase [Rufibacter roseus]|uniref:Aminotransferase n=1 Tax=Rufibacter roseus TaxID=1567108 RepID=A0ABW2DPN5_9BACT|nr:aminotransferase class I/II-fold pyridoxal phosphate-dependent enzyme [Rufibacter roseus]